MNQVSSAITKAHSYLLTMIYVFQVNYRCKNRFPFPVGGDESISCGDDLQWTGVPLHCDTKEAGE